MTHGMHLVSHANFILTLINSGLLHDKISIAEKSKLRIGKFRTTNSYKQKKPDKCLAFSSPGRT